MIFFTGLDILPSVVESVVVVGFIVGLIVAFDVVGVSGVVMLTKIWIYALALNITLTEKY